MVAAVLVEEFLSPALLLPLRMPKALPLLAYDLVSTAQAEGIDAETRWRRGRNIRGWESRAIRCLVVTLSPRGVQDADVEIVIGIRTGLHAALQSFRTGGIGFVMRKILILITATRWREVREGPGVWPCVWGTSPWVQNRFL